jgi:hypothetical protein
MSGWLGGPKTLDRKPLRRTPRRERTQAGLQAVSARGRKGLRRRTIDDKKRAIAVELYRKREHTVGEFGRAGQFRRLLPDSSPVETRRPRKNDGGYVGIGG